MLGCVLARKPSGTAESQNLSMQGNFKRENRETVGTSQGTIALWERSANASGGTADMRVNGESDGSIVPTKRANKAGTPVAELVEERESPKGSIAELSSKFQTQSWIQHQSERHDSHDW